MNQFIEIARRGFTSHGEKTRIRHSVPKYALTGRPDKNPRKGFPCGSIPQNV